MVNKKYERNNESETQSFSIPINEVYKPLSALTEHLDKVVFTFNEKGVLVTQLGSSEHHNHEFISASVDFDTGLNKEMSFTVQYKKFMNKLMEHEKLEVDRVEFTKKNRLIKLNSPLLTSFILCIQE